MIPHKAFPFLGQALLLARSFGYLYDYEVLAIQTLVRTLPDDAQIVNIGAGSGTSGLAIVEARPDLAINTWTIDKSEGGPFGGLENERNAFKGTGWSGPNQLLKDSAVAGKEWLFGALDFIFIDGDHSEEGLKKDIDAWYPHMKPGSYMAFHDYDSVNWPGVKKVVDYEMRMHQEMFLVCTLDVYRVIK